MSKPAPKVVVWRTTSWAFGTTYRRLSTRVKREGHFSKSANVRGPRGSRRKLIMSTVNSVLPYGTEKWVDAFKKECYRKWLCRVQWQATLCVASSYRTVSETANLWYLESSMTISRQEVRRLSTGDKVRSERTMQEYKNVLTPSNSRSSGTKNSADGGPSLNY